MDVRLLAGAVLETVLPVQGVALPRAQWPDVVGWIQRHCWLTDTLPPQQMVIYPVQERALREALALEPDGSLRYVTVVWSWPKKSAKSTLLAHLVHYTACNRPGARIRLVGNDLKQADSRVGHYLRETLFHGQRLGDTFAAGVEVKRYFVQYPNGSTVEMVPVDPRGEAGGNDDLVVCSELWGWKHDAHVQMWSEMTLPPTKFGQAQTWIDTYAGIRGESPVLEQLYETGVVNGAELSEGLYANGSARQLTVWVTRPTLPWQVPEYYAIEKQRLPPAHFERMHRNAWVESDNAFVPAAWWEACVGDVSGAAGLPIVLGVDAGVSSDHFAIVGVTRIDEQVYVVLCQVWKPPPQGRLDFSVVEDYLRDVCARYNVAQIAYDPHQLHDMMTRLRRESVAWCDEFLQGKERLIADAQLYANIRDRRITHPAYPDLTEHVLSANQHITGDDDKLRLVKRSANHKIDAAVALSMANARARALTL